MDEQQWSKLYEQLKTEEDPDKFHNLVADFAMLTETKESELRAKKTERRWEKTG
ncbi:MAG: hypothetical protein WAQ52_18315 [Terriglobales bacterium]